MRRYACIIIHSILFKACISFSFEHLPPSRVSPSKKRPSSIGLHRIMREAFGSCHVYVGSARHVLFLAISIQTVLTLHTSKITRGNLRAAYKDRISCSRLRAVPLVSRVLRQKFDGRINVTTACDTGVISTHLHLVGFASTDG